MSRPPLIEQLGSLVYQQNYLEGWFDYKACLLASQMKPPFSIHGPNPKAQIWQVRDKIIPKWAQDWLSLMPIGFISIREGMEANYLVFLTPDMLLFHETYLVS